MEKQFQSYLQANVFFWKKLLPATWEKISLEEKLVWILFISQTIAIITMLEYLVFHN